MRKFSALALFTALAVSVAVMWVQAKWVSTIPETATFLLVALWAAAFALGDQRPRLHRALIPLSGVLIWSLLQIVLGYSIYNFESWLGLLYWAGNVSAFFVALQAFKNRKILSMYLSALALFGFVVSALSALQALTSNGRIFWIFPTVFAGWNPMGPFAYHNQFAAFIEILLPISLYKTFTNSNRKAIYILISATMYAAVIISASRTGFVLTTAELILVPMMVARSRTSPVSVSGVALGTSVLLAMVILLGISAGPEVLAGRFAAKDPYAVRREFVYSSLAMIRDRPLHGVGLRNWPTAYPAYALFDSGLIANQAHNDWAQWTVEGGLPLLALMLWLAFCSVPAGVRLTWGIGIGAIFLHCLVDYPIQKPAISLLFFTVMGAVLTSDVPGE